jgi:hypothetical protein
MWNHTVGWTRKFIIYHSICNYLIIWFIVDDESINVLWTLEFSQFLDRYLDEIKMIYSSAIRDWCFIMELMWLEFLYAILYGMLTFVAMMVKAVYIYAVVVVFIRHMYMWFYYLYTPSLLFFIRHMYMWSYCLYTPSLLFLYGMYTYGHIIYIRRCCWFIWHLYMWSPSFYSVVVWYYEFSYTVVFLIWEWVYLCVMSLHIQIYMCWSAAMIFLWTFPVF